MTQLVQASYHHSLPVSVPLLNAARGPGRQAQGARGPGQGRRLERRRLCGGGRVHGVKQLGCWPYHAALCRDWSSTAVRRSQRF